MLRGSQTRFVLIRITEYVRVYCIVFVLYANGSVIIALLLFLLYFESIRILPTVRKHQPYSLSGLSNKYYLIL